MKQLDTEHFNALDANTLSRLLSTSIPKPRSFSINKGILSHGAVNERWSYLQIFRETILTRTRRIDRFTSETLQNVFLNSGKIAEATTLEDIISVNVNTFTTRVIIIGEFRLGEHSTPPIHSIPLRRSCSMPWRTVSYLVDIDICSISRRSTRNHSLNMTNTHFFLLNPRMLSEISLARANKTQILHSLLSKLK